MTYQANQQTTPIFDNRDIARYTPGERRMAMRGFEPDYSDMVDYIVRITHRIWEEKEVGYIYDTYQHNCIVHGSGGDVHGREAVVASTLQSLAAFGEDIAYADDVIWAGNEVDGFHTSHLVHATSRNIGWSGYGPPTGRKIISWSLPFCLVKDNMIFEEWVLRDELSVVRQLGVDLDALVERQVRDLLAQGVAPVPASDSERMLGQYAPQPLPTRSSDGGLDVEDFVRTTYHELWNRRRLNTITRRYATNHLCYTSLGRKLQGQGERASHVLNTLAMFPDAGVSVDHVYWNGDDEKGYHVAVRWTLSGTHSGYGAHGAPSGARIRVMGLSQHHIKHGIFTQEFMLIDEMSILRQIAVRRLS